MSDGANVLQIETRGLSQLRSLLRIKEIGRLVESVKNVKCFFLLHKCEITCLHMHT